MKTNEFHKPFIKSLLVIAIVTVVAMISSHYIIEKLYFKYYKTPSFTSENFQYDGKIGFDERL
jgi:hypothetical protein